MTANTQTTAVYPSLKQYVLQLLMLCSSNSSIALTMLVWPAKPPAMFQKFLRQTR